MTMFKSTELYTAKIFVSFNLVSIIAQQSKTLQLLPYLQEREELLLIRTRLKRTREIRHTYWTIADIYRWIGFIVIVSAK